MAHFLRLVLLVGFVCTAFPYMQGICTPQRTLSGSKNCNGITMSSSTPRKAGWDGRKAGNRAGPIFPADKSRQAPVEPDRAQPRIERSESRSTNTPAQVNKADAIQVHSEPPTTASPSKIEGLSPQQEQQILAFLGDKLSLSLGDVLNDEEDDDEGDYHPENLKGQRPNSLELERREDLSAGDYKSGQSRKQPPSRREATSASPQPGISAEAGAADAQSEGCSTEVRLEFAVKGHVKLTQLVTGSALKELRTAADREFERRAEETYRQKLRVFGLDAAAVARLSSIVQLREALEDVCERKGLEVPFLQLFNPHRGDSAAAATIRSLATAPRMGRLAAELLGVEGVLLYQTSLFYKQAGHGETAWHSDLNTAPLDTSDMVTVWVALSGVPDLDHSPLEFASRSHRDFALPFWYTNEAMADLSSRGYTVESHVPLAPGDATAHHGWLLHAAPPNTSPTDRRAVAFTYIAAGARRLPAGGAGGAGAVLRREPDDEDLESYAPWLPHVPPGRPVDHPSLPLVYSTRPPPLPRRARRRDS